MAEHLEFPIMSLLVSERLEYIKNVAAVYAAWSMTTRPDRFTNFETYDRLTTDRERGLYLDSRTSALRNAFREESVDDG